MTAADLIRLCLELDQQVINPRPSEWGKAALLVAVLCQHAESSLRDPTLLGDWESIDLLPINRRAPGQLNQPILDAILKSHEISTGDDS